MQIYVRYNKYLNNASTSIEVEDGATWASDKHTILTRFNLNPAPHIEVYLLLASRPVSSGTLLIRAATYDLVLKMPSAPVVDQEVMLLLNIRLQKQITEPRPKHFILISTGSHINGNKGHDEAQFQQCPADIEKYCAEHELHLSVILIDLDFKNKHSGTQIYNSDPHWQRWLEELLDGKVRHYKHIETGNTLSTYDTHIPDWGMNITHLADIDLLALGNAVNGAGGQVLVRVYNGDICFNSYPELAFGKRY